MIAAEIAGEIRETPAGAGDAATEGCASCATIGIDNPAAQTSPQNADRGGFNTDSFSRFQCGPWSSLNESCRE